ncbi:MAG: hypothetical protein LBC26_01385, partial [Oscillospiraceae bacterium]|nr:hypothetical protein [Oscillospiraceae bacterium]
MERRLYRGVPVCEIKQEGNPMLINDIGFIMLMLFFALMIGRGFVMGQKGITLLVIGQKNKRELFSFLFGYALMIYIIASNCFPLPMPTFANRFFWNAEWLR